MTGDDGLYLGVDVGTAATRISLVRPDGTAVAASAVVASAGYRTVRGGDGRVEQDPAAWSRALATALRGFGFNLASAWASAAARASARRRVPSPEVVPPSPEVVPPSPEAVSPSEVVR